ncbi:hypothetical protein ACRAWF_05545 [Streptomyces sp. L7]
MGFGAQKCDGAGEALFAQGDRGLHSGHARADDDHAPCRPRALSRCLLAHPITVDT